jgi:hypothetical protein
VVEQTYVYLIVVKTCEDLLAQEVDVCHPGWEDERVELREFVQREDPYRVVVGSGDEKSWLLWDLLQRRYTLAVRVVSMDEFFPLLKFPNHDLPRECRRYEVPILLTYENIGDVVFVRGQLLVPEQYLTI